MNYELIRQKFIEMSGRYDLINPSTWEDNGADAFLNKGQRYLDSKVSIHSMKASRVSVISAGDFYVRCLGLRTVLNVWITNSDKNRVMLEKEDVSFLREYYGTDYSEITQGSPVYYAPVSIRPYPDTTTGASLVAAGAQDYADLMLDDTHYRYNGILFLPPADGTYTVRVEGYFYSPELSATKSGITWTRTKSFWSEEFPMTLIDAGMRELELSYQNASRIAYMEAAIESVTSALDKDFVEEENVDCNEMEG